MPRFLSIILDVTGRALGFGVVALLIGLDWPDAASSADHCDAGRASRIGLR
jgi:hypothetical protein